MGTLRSRRLRVLLAALAAALVIAGVVVGVVLPGSSPRTRPHAVESIFQDDQLLLYSPTATVIATLRTLRALGADRVRVTVLWLSLAPDPNSPSHPHHFKAVAPSSYSPNAWAPYDRLVELAGRFGIAVDFNVTAPGPRWAMVHPAPRAALASHYRPSPVAFGRFVAAVATRYSGSYEANVAGGRQPVRLPRVSYWTIWNEPNQPGWLAPQWRTVAGARVLDSPRLYREYVDAAWAALLRTGHGPSTDTILIGELAPEGTELRRDESAVPPMPFLAALYCVDGEYRRLQGAAAAALHCPTAGGAAAFVSAHPGLFDATGFAHHPYSFFLAPSATFSDPNYVPLSSLWRLEGGLDRIFSTYGVRRRLPLYLTEYGYETDPPNPFKGVPPATQARYLDQAQYMAWKDPRVRSMAQFLLVDSAPDRAFRPGTLGYWSTFQTGLEYLDGRPKPSFGAYRLPIFVPSPSFSPGASVQIWGMLRAARNGTRQQADIQWRGPGQAFRTVARISTSDPDGFFTDRLALPGSGRLRIAWRAPDGQTLYSRAVAVQRR